MPPLTNLFGSDDDEPFEPGSYLPLQPLDGEDAGAEPNGEGETPDDPLLGPMTGDIGHPDADG